MDVDPWVDNHRYSLDLGCSLVAFQSVFGSRVASRQYFEALKMDPSYRAS